MTHLTRRMFLQGLGVVGGAVAAPSAARAMTGRELVTKFGPPRAAILDEAGQPIRDEIGAFILEI